MFKVRSLTAGYERLTVVRELGLEVGTGEIVAILGANGAGKTTALKALSGVLKHTGSVVVGETEIGGMSPAARVRVGLAHIPEGRGTFADFTVIENLRTGAYAVSSRKDVDRDIEYWLEEFPLLKARADKPAGYMSGGEQQMLALARAMMSRPKVLMCDEPSQGLSPAIAKKVFSLLAQLCTERNIAVLVVEQSVKLALDVASRAYIIDHGAIVDQGTADDLRSNDAIRATYLGADK